MALRLPCADSANQRIEYRLAGADANPYLALAVMLGGLLHGLEHPLPLPPAANGCESDNAAPLPLGQQEALALFRHSDPLRELLGPAFCTLWHTCKAPSCAASRNRSPPPNSAGCCNRPPIR